MNFKEFLAHQRDGHFSVDGDAADSSGKIHAHDTYINLPTQSSEPVKIFKIERSGKTYTIHGEKGMLWNIAAHHYDTLNQMGKAPKVGDRVRVDFYSDGNVKGFNKV